MKITNDHHRHAGYVFGGNTLNIVGPFRRTRSGDQFILTMQDQLSKNYVAVPLPNATSELIDDAFADYFELTIDVHKHGNSIQIRRVTGLLAKMRCPDEKSTESEQNKQLSERGSYHCLGVYTCENHLWIFADVRDVKRNGQER
ncbi:hypothetical protein QAD02_020115 [Eretmocerus hayati]|uniref:Uncharacterized protein n=1 Tax=Eretmocerus hayati TaxID=131215 RepID=A0ACC2PLK6_9HYME|nr:hypothetical protein QAD02_020115 [Eretmocerus hayati]